MRVFERLPIFRRHRQKCLCYGLLLACFPFSEAQSQRMEKAEEPDEVGLVTLGKGYFPKPEGVSEFKIFNGNFEKKHQKNETIELSRVEIGSDGAPEGEKFIKFSSKTVSSLIINPAVHGGNTYLFSLWLKTNGELAGMATCDTSEVSYGKHTPLNLPDTNNEWRRVGFYFRAAPGSESVRILIRRPPGGPEVALDDLRFREASPEEFALAYAGWRSQYPARDLSPRPEDGRNLALFVSKLVNHQKSTEPLLVMGIGSSYTNMLGNGERLIQWIREKFPDAPPIIYKKHVGSAVNFDFTRGWMRQYVLGQRPDLVILYSGGEAEDLELLLKDFRAHSTADVIVASLHLRERDIEITDATVNAPEWDAIREVAMKYGCEWVDNRREWAAYLKEHEQPIEWLLKDAVHQNDHGALVINENICRHIVAGEKPAYEPEMRERFLSSRNFDEKNREGEFVKQGLFMVGGRLHALAPANPQIVGGQESKFAVNFRGNRLDIEGIRSSAGASAEFTIDGIPAGEFPAFHTTLIVPGPKNHKPDRGSAADRSPHMIRLGDLKKVFPQKWTIRMTSDRGDFELAGSVTGPDGKGNNGTDFTSDSGQIIVPTALWRRRLEKDGAHSNRTGDTWSWEVSRATAEDGMTFKGEHNQPFRTTLADQLENGWHEAVLTFTEGGAVGIRGFRVFEPPVKPDSD